MGLALGTRVECPILTESGVPLPPLSALGGLMGAGRRGLRDCNRKVSEHIMST